MGTSKRQQVVNIDIGSQVSFLCAVMTWAAAIKSCIGVLAG